MNNFFKVGAFLLVSTLCATTSFAQTAKYKCMLQMNSYSGEKAYVIVSLMKPNGTYEKTLAVLGNDKQWYNTLKEWYKFKNKSAENLSAVTGASVGGGDRAMRVLEIDESKFNKGYKLRFESAVEEQKYHEADIEIPLTSIGLSTSAQGNGYIKFVKFNKAQ